MKNGRYVDIEVHENFNTGYGTVDCRNLKSVYSKITSWIVPNYEYENWRSIVGVLKRNIHNKLNEELRKTDKFKNDRFIVDLDIRSKGLQKGKKSFMNCEITLFTNGEHDLRDVDFKLEMNNIIKSVIQESIVKYDKFNYYKTKRG